MADPHELYTFLLRVGDDNLILAQRLGELVSWMPELEEDIAVANVALDHLGQARNVLTYAARMAGPDASEDTLAMERSEREFLNAVLVEQPNGDFGQTMARQLFVDAYQVPFYEALATSSDDTVAGIAAKAVKEARYHLARSSNWVVVLGDGTDESHQRMQAGIDAMWRYTADLFFTDETEEALQQAGILPSFDNIRGTFDDTVSSVLARGLLALPEDPYQRIGGRTGFHTEHLGHLLPDMQALHRANAGASW